MGVEAKTSVGVCITGGGITGAMYSVGAVAALEDELGRLGHTGFDALVGMSSGATVAACVAGGLSAQRLYRALLDPADDFFPLQRHHLLRPDAREWRRVWRSAMVASRKLMSSALSRPLELNFWSELERFVDSLPAGVFDLGAYERFLSDFFDRRNIPKAFDQMPSQLLLVASDLDRGQRVVFGRGSLASVSVTEAVAAASAIPMLFAPVRIDNRDYVDSGIGEMAHVDLAYDMGCRLIFVVNPMVPVSAEYHDRAIPTGHGPMRRVRDKGLLWVYNQWIRVLVHARFDEGLSRFRQNHPDAEVVLIEPQDINTTLFMHSPMNFSARRALLREGYVTTQTQVRARENQLQAKLKSPGSHLLGRN